MFKIFGWMMFNVLKYSKILINALIPNGAPTIVILKVNVYTWIVKHNQDHSQHLYLNWKYIQFIIKKVEFYLFREEGKLKLFVMMAGIC